MPFSHRVFCRLLETPSLSEVLVWLRQQGHPATIAGAAGFAPGVGKGGGKAAGAGEGTGAADLLSCYWDEARVQGVDEDAPLHLRCLRLGSSGADPIREELGDFIGDVSELPSSPAATRVLEHLGATRCLLVVRFPEEGTSSADEEAAQAITALFATRAQGLVQRDGVGFVDEDDDLVLALA